MKILLRYGFLLLTLILLWQCIVTYFQLPDYLLPPPFQVVETLWAQHLLLLKQTWPTLLETLVGFTFGVLFGLCAGMCTALFKPFRYWFLPLLLISQAIPTFAIAPLFVLWLGYGISSKIAITVLMIFFPIASSFYDGLIRTPPHLLELARTLNASHVRTFIFIQIPAALPRLGSGLRIAAVSAPLGAIVGEWAGASKGLGILMITANARMQIDLMFAALMILIALALLFYFTIDKLWQKLVWWPT